MKKRLIAFIMAVAAMLAVQGCSVSDMQELLDDTQDMPAEETAAVNTFANFEGEFYPIGDLFDIRIGAKMYQTYEHGGENHMLETNIISTEQIEWNGEGDFYDIEQSLSSIRVDGEEYKIHNVFNLEYVGVADLNPAVDGFEIAVIDNGVSDDLSVALYTFDGENLSYINTYGGTTYEYYENGTGTVYCDGNGHIINQYIGFTEPMYAYSVDSFFDGGSGVTVLEPDIIGKELKLRRDLYAYYIPVDEYPGNFNDIWDYTDEQLTTVAKDTPVIIDEIAYMYDEETGERYVLGYYARIDGSKYVIQLQYAG